MPLIYSSGVNPISTTLASSPSGGATSFSITSSTGLPTIATGGFGTARINDGSAEDIRYTRSGTTITLFSSDVLASGHSSGAAIDFDVLSQPALDQYKDDAISGYPENALSGAGALVSGGVTNHITITSAGATFTLANGVTYGQLCRIRMDRTCTKLATIDPAGATTIDGATTRIMWAGETALLSWNGTEWNKIAGKSLPMIGSMRLNSSTANTVNAVQTPVPLDTSVVDNTGLMVNTGSSEITLQRPGNYFTCGFVLFEANGVGSGNTQGLVVQNSTVVVQSLLLLPNPGLIVVGGSNVFIGAAGDNITLQYYQNSGGTTPTILAGSGSGGTALAVVEQPSW